MATPSSERPGTLQVLGILVDLAYLCQQNVSVSDTVDQVVQSLWTTVSKRVDKDSTSEIPHSSLVKVVLESDLGKLKPGETTFSALNPKKPKETYIVLFGMPSSWSYVGVSKGNKENAVTGMANLSIADDEASNKLTGGSNKPNVPSKPQGIGLCTKTSPLPLTAPHNDSIESLRQELLGKIDGQANDIRSLQSSNDELASKVNWLTSTNVKLTAKVNGLTSSGLTLKINGLTSTIDGLTSSNLELSEKVRKLETSNTDMSSTLQSLSFHPRRTKLKPARRSD